MKLASLAIALALAAGGAAAHRLRAPKAGVKRAREADGDDGPPAGDGPRDRRVHPAPPRLVRFRSARTDKFLRVTDLGKYIGPGGFPTLTKRGAAASVHALVDTIFEGTIFEITAEGALKLPGRHGGFVACYPGDARNGNQPIALFDFGERE